MAQTITVPFGPKPEMENVDVPQDRTEIDRLRSTCDLYDIYSPLWRLYVNAYEGGPSMANRYNVFKHQREHEEDFEDRVRRLHYINICGPLIDFYTDFIFTESIQRDGGDSATWFQDFIKDVDKKGTNITAFMKHFSDDLQIFGMAHVLVDSPLSPQGIDIITKYDEQDLGIRPYWVRITPLEILDWVTDDFDRYLYVKRVQLVREIDNGAPVTFEKYTEITPTTTIVSYVDITDSVKPVLRQDKRLELVNKIGKIPLYTNRFKRSKTHEFMGNSFLRDMAMNNREAMNLTSILQEFLYRQCFNILAKETDGGISEASQDEGIEGTSNVMEYPKGAHAPQYITPPSGPAEFIQNERERIIQSMYKQAAQDLMSELFNGEKSSGFSQAQSFSKTVPFIATRADILEDSETSLFSLTAEYFGDGNTFSGKIKYKDRYELTNITDAISQLTMVFRDLMMPSETFVKEELKRLVHELDDKVPTELMTEVLAEIDSMDFEKWQETQKDALIGIKGTSPAAQQKPKSTGTMAEASQEARTTNVAATKKLKGK